MLRVFTLYSDNKNLKVALSRGGRKYDPWACPFRDYTERLSHTEERLSMSLEVFTEKDILVGFELQIRMWNI